MSIYATALPFPRALPSRFLNGLQETVQNPRWLRCLEKGKPSRMSIYATALPFPRALPSRFLNGLQETVEKSAMAQARL
jgi:hypothetical protein